MSYIYGTVCRSEDINPEALAILKADLQRYPTDGYVEFSHEMVSGGLFYQNLRKPPFPSEEPVRDRDTGIVIFASARLDYRPLLLKKLELKTHQLNQFTDTQLILRAYLMWGENCVNYLEGDFSFLIWNPSKQYLWGARDPLGFKPLFFTIQGETCFFSSHTSGLAHLPNTDKTPDEGFFANRLLGAKGSILATPYTGVSQIPIGHTIKIDSGKVNITKYYHWQTVPIGRKVSRNDYASEASRLLSDAVETRLYTDHPVGGFLSGGLDSSSVLAIVQSHLHQKSQTNRLFTASSVHPEGSDTRYEDERPWVEMFKKHFPDTQITFCTLKDIPPFRPEDAEFFSTIRLRRYPTGFMREMMEEKLVEEGCRTYFTGWRGDHFISRRGYAHYTDFLKRGKVGTFIRAILDTAAFTDRSPKTLLKAVIKNNLYNKPFNPKTFSGSHFLNQEWVDKVLTRSSIRTNQKRKWKFNDVNQDFFWLLPDRAGTQQYYEDTSYYQKSILKRMIPLSDPRIINFTLQLPAEEFSKEGMDRSIMRRAVKHYLPDELRLRNTKGSFMGNESAIAAKVHQKWLEQGNITQIINESPLSKFINTDQIIKYIDEHKKNISKGHVDLHLENTYLLNLLGFLFFFDIRR